MRLSRLTIAILIATAASQSAFAGAVAFPGAEGAGKNARGGRGGDVYHVANLRDSGPGSFRHGIDNATGPRTIVFDVGGTIDLASPISVDRPFITVAGQTAPGGGITLKGYPLVIHSTHDVIVRYIRTRPGDIRTEPSVNEPDALSAVNSKNIIIDHVSASWSTDEVLSVTHESNNVTVQWCLITEALNNSHHHKGSHGYGSLINGGDFTFHHNLFADNTSRNPRPSQTAGVMVPTRLDFVNNVIYNSGIRYGYGGDDTMYLNFVNNYGISGPNTSHNKLFQGATAETGVYQSGNFMDTNKDGVLNGICGGWVDFDGGFTRSSSRFELPVVNTEIASKALDSVTTKAGASLVRDAVDKRVIADVRSCGLRGRIIDSQNEVGGWPCLQEGKALSDTDQDGMPDSYENSVSYSNPHDASDRNADANGNGYTDIEDYLHFLTTRQAPVQASGSGNVKK